MTIAARTAIRGLLLSLLLCGGNGWADLTLRAQLASDLVVRGVSHTGGEPLLGGSIEWDGRGGWFLGAAGHYATEQPFPALTRGVRGYLGWFGEIGGAQAVELSLAHNVFPGDFPTSWDYTEARAGWHLTRELSLAFTASGDYYGRDTPALFAGVTWMPALSERVYARITGGAVHLTDNTDSWLAHASFGLGLRVQRLDLSASFSLANPAVERFFPFSDRQNAVIRLDYVLR